MLPDSLTRFSRATYSKLKASKLLRLGAVKIYIFSKMMQMKKTNNVVSVNSFIRILICLLTCIYPFLTRTYLLSKNLDNEYFKMKLFENLCIIFP